VAQQASIRRSNLSQIRTRGLTRIKRLFWSRLEILRQL